MAGIEKTMKTISNEAQYFIENTLPSVRHVSLFDKMKELFPDRYPDVNPRTDDSSATRSKRSKARKLLVAVEDIGFEAFLLCCFSLSITTLGEIKSHHEFIEAFQGWLKANPIPQNLSEVAKQCRDNHYTLERTKKTDCQIPSRKRRHGDLESEVEQPLETQPRQPSISHDGGEVPSGNGDGRRFDDQWDLSDDEEDGDYAEEVNQPPVDAPFSGRVYSLKNMDVIRMLATAKEDLGIQLTIPDHRGVKPFIMFRCSERTAMRYLTKLDQMDQIM
ncbi:hypothetical protein B0I35DRAFT_447497 [Stachybotrys elegans]|uniref:Uncharacterized protein n=1 Tax=Stachybotrys elegans TaxID=80388 RepID=A0A8K0WK54_9HYPO|nr:hypothetical protein B0I35DRAFT_447497 [Stachybotrys elegans]